MKKAVERMYALEDQSADLIFILQDDDGEPVKTELSLFWKNYKNDSKYSSKTLLVTTFPPSERGEGFLLWEHQNPDASEFWMYFPSLRQTRKIQRLSMENGLRESDLLFEDMSRMKLEAGEYRVGKEARFQGENCWLIQADFPKSFPYGQKKFWVSKKRGVPLKIEYYDFEQQPVKTQVIRWEEQKGFHVWKETIIQNFETRRSTTIQLKNVKINTGLPERIFSKRNLERGVD